MAMQCPSCQFENLPRAVRCGRCTGILRVGSRALTVSPLRATAAAKRLRAALPRRLHGVRCSRGVQAMRLALWLLVPGGVQWLYRSRLPAAAMLGAYTLLLLSAAAFVGTWWGAVALGGAIVVHAISATHASLNNRNSGQAVWHAPLSAVCLILLFYGCLYCAASRYVTVRRVVEAAGPLATGDLLLIRRYGAHAPEAGDVVLYEIRPLITRSMHDWPRALVCLRGERVDRVLAVAGDCVHFRQQGLFVNGQPALHRPLAGAVPYRSHEVIVPAATCLVMPSTDRHFARMLADRSVEQVWLVPTAQLVGRVSSRIDRSWRVCSAGSDDLQGEVSLAAEDRSRRGAK